MFHRIDHDFSEAQKDLMILSSENAILSSPPELTGTISEKSAAQTWASLPMSLLDFSEGNLQSEKSTIVT